jgi:hypothetical protein
MGRLRPAGGERGHQAQPAPSHFRRPQHRGDEAADPVAGHRLRLGPGDQHQRTRLLPLDSVGFPPALRPGPRLPPRRARQLVSELPDRPGERGGRQRALRAMRHAGRGEGPAAVVLQDHGLLGPPAGRPRPAGRVARTRAPDAGELDRPERGGAGLLQGGPYRRPDAVFHHAARHALGRHLHEPGARAPGHLRPSSIPSTASRCRSGSPTTR